MSKLTRKQLLERAEWRSIAIGAVFSVFRNRGVEPKNNGFMAIGAVLDDLARTAPETIAAMYWKKYSSDDAEWERFKKAWMKRP